MLVGCQQASGPGTTTIFHYLQHHVLSGAASDTSAVIFVNAAHSRRSACSLAAPGCQARSTNGCAFQA